LKPGGNLTCFAFCQLSVCSEVKAGMLGFLNIGSGVQHHAAGPAPLLRGSISRGGDSRSFEGSPSGAGFWASGATVFGATAAVAATRRKQSKLARFADSSEDGPTLESGMGIDYSQLQEFLQAKDFQAADAETRSLLIKIAGEAAVKRGWIYFAEVKSMPEKDISTVENLWQHYSEGKFGFAQQRKIWKKVRGQFDKFAEEVSWFTDTWTNRNWPDEFIYTLEAPVGHLPLTNCIRGAQVLEELLNHPAVEKKKASAVKKTSSTPSSSSSTSETGERKSALSMLAGGHPRHAALPGPAAGPARFVGGRSSACRRLQACRAAPAPLGGVKADLAPAHVLAGLEGGEAFH